MLLACYYLDASRQEVFAAIVKARLAALGSSVRLQRDLAEEYARGLLEALSPSNGPEPQAIFQGALASIQQVAKQAAIFWNRALELQKAVLAGTVFRDRTAQETARPRGGHQDGTRPSSDCPAFFSGSPNNCSSCLAAK